MLKYFINRIFSVFQTLLLCVLYFTSFSYNANAKSLGLSGFELRNPKTGDFIANAAVISVDDYFTLNLQDFPDGITFFYTYGHFTSSGIKKVIFFINDAEVRTEKITPYALAGDYNGKIFPYKFALGDYKLSAVVYFNDNSETPFEETIFFQVENSPKLAEVQLLDSQTDKVFKVFKPVNKFQPFQYQEYLNLEESPKYFSLAVIRNDAIHEIKSIVFEYAYTAPNQFEQPLKYLRTENIEPYTLFGDYPKGDFAGIQLQEGTYKILATPYSEPGGRGVKGKPTGLYLNVTKSASKSFLSINNSTDEFFISPNPIINESIIYYQSVNTSFVNIELLDLQGNVVKKVYQGAGLENQNNPLKLNRKGIRKGMYLLRIQSNNKVIFSRVLIK